MRNNAVHKQITQLFDTWQFNQDVFCSNAFLSSKRNRKRLESYYDRLRHDYRAYPGALKQLDALWAWLHQDTLKTVPELITYLEENFFCTQTVFNEELAWSIHKIIKKYNAFIRLLFMDVSHVQQKRLLYFLANDFFYFCFDPNNKRMDVIIQEEALQPIARMLYAIMWIHLGGRGWQSWHQQMLSTLKHASDNGNEIVYIAGGSDINQLLKQGIYNIRIIDPFFPTQDTYYSRGWKFLIKGVVGDTITWPFEGKTLLLKRRLYQEHGYVNADASDGKKRRIPQATIIWDIFDHESHKRGQLTIEKRFASQEDFSYNIHKSILISFNELYFVTTPHEAGWNIDIDQLDPRFQMYVKQLDSPLAKNMLLRMRHLDEVFEFIQLGNCID